MTIYGFLVKTSGYDFGVGGTSQLWVQKLGLKVKILGTKSTGFST